MKHNGTNLINIVKEYFNEIRKSEGFADIGNETLCDNGEIYYMNGNDGTSFDWFMNGRCCEFMIFHKETEMGFLKVFVGKDGTIDGYGYLDNGRSKSIELKAKHIGEEEALALACLMKTVADNKNIYDKPLNNLNFDVEIDTTKSTSILK